jgi:tRNA nucleotidyltransferase (CCA-adding enzyme)
LQGNNATWSAESNVALRGLSKVLEDYGKTVGWEWGGLVGGDGQPIADELGAKKSMWYREAKSGQVDLAVAPFPGATEIEIRGKKAYVDQTENPALLEWAEDFGLTLCAKGPSRSSAVAPVPITEVKEWPRVPDTTNGGFGGGTSSWTPTVFDRDTGILHVGPYGAHHFQVEDAMEALDKPTREFVYGYKDPNAYTFQDKVENVAQHELIAKALGLPPRLENDNFFKEGRVSEIIQLDQPVPEPDPTGFERPYHGDRRIPFFFHKPSGKVYMGKPSGYHHTMQPPNGGPLGEHLVAGGYWPEYPKAELYDSNLLPEHVKGLEATLNAPVEVTQWHTMEDPWNFSARTAEYPGGGNAMDKMKEWEHLDGHDKGNPEAEPRPTDFGEIEGPVECPDCGKMCRDFMELQLHAQEHEGLKPEPRPDGHFPWPEDKDAPLPLRNRNVNPTANPVMGSWHIGDLRELPTFHRSIQKTPQGWYVCDQKLTQDKETGQMHCPLHGPISHTEITDNPIGPVLEQNGQGVIYAQSTPEHPDPWMDNEPGTLTIPEHWGSWHIATLPKVIELNQGEIGTHDEFDHFTENPSIAQSRPFIYHHPTHTIYIGQPGGFHDDVIEQMPDEDWGYAGRLEPNKTYEAFGSRSENNPKLNQEIGQALGASKLHGWDFFSKKAVEEPKDMVRASIPFIYDVLKDHITTGHPGMKSSDIMGQFTPAGIVEGTYEPGGKVIINSTTNMPYSVYHLLQLWYYQHPTMEITSLEMETGDGSTTKLAGASVGSYLKQLAATDSAVWNAYQALSKAGGKVYVVGGAVRDALLQKEPKDIDLMVSGIPSEEVNHILSGLPGRVDLTGKKFGVYRYNEKGNEVEIALPREDSYEEGGKRSEGQIRVDHNLPVEDDLLRRDFTANSMAVDLDNGKLIDPYEGAKDIDAHVLRTTHPSSFKEDPTRLLRALVANSRHGLVPDERTRQEMADNASRLADESPDALKPILLKLLESPNPAGAVRLAQDTGLLHHIFPELAHNFDYDQKNPHHNYTLGEHSLHVLDNVSRASADPDVRLAALLHDIGKPASAWTDENGINHYYEKHDGDDIKGADHAKVGAEMAEARLRKGFNYPVARLNRVRQLVDGHMFPAYSTAKGARKFLNKYGENADDLLTIREGDLAGKGTDAETEQASEAKQQVEGMRNLVGQVRTQGQATDKASLAINGNDLIGMGMKPGPAIGQVLDNLMNQVVDYPELNNPTDLQNLAQGYINGQQLPNQDGQSI